MNHPHLVGAIMAAIVALALIAVLVGAIHRGSIFARWHIDRTEHRRLYLIALVTVAMLAGVAVFAAALLMHLGSLTYYPPIR